VSALDEPDPAQRWVDAQQQPPPWEDVAGRQAGGLFTARDHLGRKVPRRLGIADYLMVVARSEPARARRVPASAIVEEGCDDDGEFTLLACPCGAQPIVRSALAKCLGCERWFVQIQQGRLYVAYGAVAAPPLR
jgi:hypothetical protein